MSHPHYFTVIKTTTEKLQQVLNEVDWTSLDFNPDLVKVEYVGGRDWVVLIRTSLARPPETVLNVVKVVDAKGFQAELDRRFKGRSDGWLR